MSAPRSAFTRHARWTAAATVLGLATMIAGACGGGSGAGSGADAGEGGRSFVPGDAVGIVEFSTRTEDLQQSLDTVERIPAWSLVEPELPADDAKGLLDKAFEDAFDEEERTEGMTFRKDIEPWLGDRGGVAVLRAAVTDPDAFEDDEPPILAWVNTDDEGAATDFVERTMGKDAKQDEHEGVTIRTVDDDEGSGQTLVAVTGGAVLLAARRSDMETAINVREDGDTFAEQDEVAAMLDREDREEQVVAVVDARALLRLAADRAGKADQEEVRRAEELLRSDELGEALPDYVGTAAGIDDVGVWNDTSWAPAGAVSVTDARELAELMPLGSLTAAASAAQSDTVSRIPGLWELTRDTYDLDLDMISEECGAREADACDLVVDGLREVLEGDAIERHQRAVGEEGVTAYAQLGSGGDVPEDAEGAYVGLARVEDPEAAMQGVDEDAFERAATVLDDYGVELTEEGGEDERTYSASLTDDGEARRALVPTPQVEPLLEASSPLLRDLLSEDGLTLRVERRGEDEIVTSIPEAGLEVLEQALDDEGARVSAGEAYRRTVGAIEVPEETSNWAWLDLHATADATFAQLRAQAAAVEAPGAEPAVQRGPATPPGGPGMEPEPTIPGTNPANEILRAEQVVRRNLEHVGGVLVWTERAGDDEQVGVARIMVPIFEDELEGEDEDEDS